MPRKYFVRLLVLVLAIFTLSTPIQAFANSADDLITTAKKYSDAPYVYGGTSPSGFDCSGFTQYVFAKIGVDIPRITSDQYNTGTSVSKSELKKGDLVFFETYKPGPSHVGIYIDNGQFIHASSSSGVTISSINDPYYWKSRYLGAKRVLEIEREPLPVGQYYDVPSDFWAYEQIASLSKENIMHGYDVSLFKPNNTITRAQAAVMIAQALELTSSHNTSLFPDVPNDYWAMDAINAVKEAEIFKGDENGNFHPSDELTRDQIAITFKIAFDLQKPDGMIAAVQFSDVPSSYWAYDAIQTLAFNDITSGYEDGTFKPRNETTRAQFAVFLYKTIN